MSVPYKVYFIGDRYTGKSSFVERLLNDKFYEVLNKHFVDYQIKNFMVDNETVKIQIWDYPGTLITPSSIKSYCHHSHVLLIFYDISNRETFKLVSQFIDKMHEVEEKQSTIMIIGMKCDLENERVVSFKEGYQLANKNDYLFIEASAKDSININEAWQILLEHLLFESNESNLLLLNFNEEEEEQKQEIKNNKFFLYKNQLYPFNFDSFKKHSNYFSKNEKKLESLQIINLIETYDNFSNIEPNSIICFINYCNYNIKIAITDSNAIHLNFLAVKYEVNKLIKKTVKYISQHYLLLFNKSNEYNLNYQYEQIISDHLIEIIRNDNDKLISFPISSLYRIVCNYISKIPNDKEKENEIKDFIIKIIHYHGCEKVSLFTNLNFGKDDYAYRSKLLSFYQDISKYDSSC